MINSNNQLMIHSENECPECGAGVWYGYYIYLEEGEVVPIFAEREYLAEEDVVAIVDDYKQNGVMNECANCGLVLTLFFESFAQMPLFQLLE